MRLKNLLLLLILSTALAACGKKNVPEQGYYFKFRVKVNKRVTQPTIVSGYYGQVNRYEGDFTNLSDSTSAKKPESVRNCLLFYPIEFQSKIEEAKEERNGKTFYNLRKISKAKVEPKFVVVPNKAGFYQFDPNERDYVVLIELNKKLGYFPGGLGVLKYTENDLKELEMRIDHNASF